MDPDHLASLRPADLDLHCFQNRIYPGKGLSIYQDLNQLHFFFISASTAFLAESQPPHRKALAMYPICLFYFIISWLIISHTHT